MDDDNGGQNRISRCAPLALASLLAAPCIALAQATAAPEKQLGAVTVTATRTERPLQDAPATVTVIDAGTIERETMKDIRDIIRYEPGVSVSNNPGRFGPNSFNIRGIGGNRVLMQVDGIRLPDAFSFGSFSSASRDAMDLDALKAVEILRGPGSSLYGSDAIGGVVTYITKDPADFMRLTGGPVFASLKGGYASADGSRLVTATLAAGREDLQGLLLYTGRSGSETDNKGDVGGTGAARTEPNPQSTRDGNLLAKLVFRAHADNRFKLTLEHLDSKTATDVLTLNPSTPRTSALRGDDDARRDRLSLEHEHRDANGSLFQIARWQVYYQDSRTAQRTSETRANTTAACSGVTTGTNTCLFERSFDFRQRAAGLNAQLEKLFQTGPWSHRLVYGLDLSRTRTSEARDGLRINVTTGATTKTIAPDSFPVRDFPVSDTTLAGLFVQDEARLGDWSAIPGLRYDYYKLAPRPDTQFTKDNPGITPVEKTHQALSPKLGLLYRITPRYTLFGQYAHGFRAPPYNDVNIGFTNLAFGYTAIPNPNLKAEKSRGVEAGLRGNFGASRFSVAAFYNRYKDFIASLQALNCPGDPRCSTVVPITFQSINLNNVRIYGFEARGELALGNGFGLLGALAHAVGDDTDRHQPLNSVDPLKLVAAVRYDAPGGRYGFQLAGTFVERKKRIDTSVAPAPVASPGFSVFDLIGYWNLSKQAALSFGVFNLTDRKYFLWSDLQGVGGGTAPMPTAASLDRFSQPGRNARLTFKYQF
jgi:hemoglobin/transferrin/lactoferrin receptor protein